MGYLDDLLPYVVLGLFVVMFAFIGAAAFDGIQKYRAFDARVACLAQRREIARQFLSADVTCLPAMHRQDTTTVNLSRP